MCPKWAYRIKVKVVRERERERGRSPSSASPSEHHPSWDLRPRDMKSHWVEQTSLPVVTKCSKWPWGWYRKTWQLPGVGGWTCWSQEVKWSWHLITDTLQINNVSNLAASHHSSALPQTELLPSDNNLSSTTFPCWGTSSHSASIDLHHGVLTSTQVPNQQSIRAGPATGFAPGFHWTLHGKNRWKIVTS